LAFALEHEQYVVEVPEETRVRAQRALVKMLEMSPGP
jgi:quinolinate synthase